MLNIVDSVLNFLSSGKTEPAGISLAKVIPWLSDIGLKITNRHELSDEQAESLYAVGFYVYQNANYMQAKMIFLYILLGTITKKVDTKALMALGACCQAEKEYETALKIYRLCILLEMPRMEIHFYAAECLLHLKKIEDAIKELNYILISPKKPPASNDLLNKAKALLQILNHNNSKS